MDNFEIFKQDIKQDIKNLKDELKDEMKEIKLDTNAQLAKTNEALMSINDVLHNLQLMIIKEYVEKEELQKVEKDIKIELEKVEDNANTKINHIDSKLKTHIKEEKDNRWKICGLAIGVPTFILAFIEVLKNLLN